VAPVPAAVVAVAVATAVVREDLAKDQVADLEDLADLVEEVVQEVDQMNQVAEVPAENPRGLLKKAIVIKIKQKLNARTKEPNKNLKNKGFVHVLEVRKILRNACV
jgi:hypothetical protein